MLQNRVIASLADRQSQVAGQRRAVCTRPQISDGNDGIDYRRRQKQRANHRNATQRLSRCVRRLLLARTVYRGVEHDIYLRKGTPFVGSASPIGLDGIEN
jgi:hypothetical protein